MTLLIGCLLGKDLKKPRCKMAYNVWGPQHRFFVNPLFSEHVQADNIPAKRHAAVRSELYKELFEELDEEEKEEWRSRAKEEHEASIKELTVKLKEKPSTSPEARQR